MTPHRDSVITGREPRLSVRRMTGQRRLSLRGLATTLNLLPPHAISLEAAAAALRSENLFVRYAAARLLGRRGDRAARLVFQTVLEEGEAPARASAARELHCFSWFSVEPLIRRALQDTDVRVRKAVVYALCEMRSVSAYQTLIERLGDEEDSVRDAAAWGLRECRDPGAVPVLQVVATRAAAPAVRVRALEALGANGSLEGLPVVRAQVDDPDPDVKYAATLSWLELAGATCLPEVAEVIRRESGAARQVILRGFFHATNYLAIDVARTPAVDVLLDALDAATQDASPEARMAAVWPLAWIAHERASRILRRAYYDERDERVRAHCVRVTASLMSDAGAEILSDALNSQSQTLRDAAELAQLAARHHRVDDKPIAGEGPIWKR